MYQIMKLSLRAILVLCFIVCTTITTEFLLWPGWTASLTRPVLSSFPFKTPFNIPSKTVNDSMSKPASTISTSSLRKLCDNTTWTEGLWLSCHSHCGADKDALCGGLNNARCRFQTCIRLAIDAGAGLVLPRFMERSETTLGPHDGIDEVCAADFWDSKQLVENLKLQCPQLQIRLCGNSTGLGPKIKSSGTRHFNDASYTFGSFRKLVQEDLAKSNVTNISASNPARIDFWDSMFSWNYTASFEAETIRKDLFKTLLYNPEILRLGAEIFSLTKVYAPFVGIHLRGERDWPSHYGTVEVQMEHFTRDLERLRNTTIEDIKDVYVSCGDQKAIERFRKILQPLNYTVHDKWTVLADHLELRAKMENLTFDQKGIVEYTTLTSADYFLGVGLSSMSLLIAFARTVDEKLEYFTEYIYPNSTRKPPYNRLYEGSPAVRGNKKTRLLMVNGPDIMDRYP